MPISESQRDWHPGSFTKNFTWGLPDNGLRELHTNLRVGFDGNVQDTVRETYIERVAGLERPFQIPTNFFLFNEIRDGRNYLVADELVFQAIEFEYSRDFDKIALIAFLTSLAGRWKGARSFQRWPSLWAKFFVIDKVSEQGWNNSQISADNIEKFIKSDRRYTGDTSRKVATNLNHLFRCVDLSSLDSKRVQQWWVSSLFLVLDRIIRDRKIDGLSTSDSELSKALSISKFTAISGPRSLEKELATPHIIELYKICGREMRFDEEIVKNLTAELLSERAYRPNSSDPIGAAHPSNFKIRQYIPRMCALLAMYAGFITFEMDEIEELDTEGFIKRKLSEALVKLKQFGIIPTMSVSELMKITRDK